MKAKSIELQLLGWRRDHNSGSKVTFQVHDDDLEYFESMTVRKGKVAGQRLMAALVEIDENEQPVSEPLGPLAKWAVVRCKEEQFQAWIADKYGTWKALGFDLEDTALDAEASARSLILQICRIDSRRELDTDAEAAKAFHIHIRGPYAEALADA